MIMFFSTPTEIQQRMPVDLKDVNVHDDIVACKEQLGAYVVHRACIVLATYAVFKQLFYYLFSLYILNW